MAKLVKITKRTKPPKPDSKQGFRATDAHLFQTDPKLKATLEPSLQPKSDPWTECAEFTLQLKESLQGKSVDASVPSVSSTAKSTLTEEEAKRKSDLRLKQVWRKVSKLIIEADFIHRKLEKEWFDRNPYYDAELFMIWKSLYERLEEYFLVYYTDRGYEDR
jgi:hypothetical protein